MNKIKKVLLSLLVVAVMLGVTVLPVSAASTLYGYPQMVGAWDGEGSIIMRGVDGTRGTRYSRLVVDVDTVTVGEIAVLGAVAGDNVTYTDETGAANDTGGADMNLLPTVPVENDTYYFSSTVPYSGLNFDIGTQGAGNWTVVWEYWNGAAYVALGNVTDSTVGFTAAAGEHTVVWADWPTAWAKRTLAYSGGTVASGYVVRARVSAFSDVVTPPEGDQVWCLTDNVLTGVVALMSGDDTIAVSEAAGYVGYGRRPQFVLMVKDTENVSGFSGQIQGAVNWDGATIKQISGRMYGQYSTGTGTPYYFSGTFNSDTIIPPS